MDINAIWIKRDTYMVTKKLNNKKTVSLQITDINSGIKGFNFSVVSCLMVVFTVCAGEEGKMAHRHVEQDGVSRLFAPGSMASTAF